MIRSSGARYVAALISTLGVLVAGGVRAAAAVPRVHALIIGNNQTPPPLRGTPEGVAALTALQFADDDAAAFYDLVAGAAADAHLLTVMDRDTQTLYPHLATLARAPSIKELRAAVAAIAVEIEADLRAGRRSTLFFFFSGHGSVVNENSAALALLDGGITQQVLYDEILELLPADVIHLLVDACHAETVVRPRDTQAQTVRVAAADAQALLVRSTLARFPNAGAIVAAAANAPSHEWDVLRHGVFTHELLSGMRGAADVNRDRKIEYSELYAFLGAANRKVDDARARLAIVARPPDVDRRSVIWDLNRVGDERIARLTGVPGRAGLVRVEDRAGRLLASLHGEPGFAADLMLPAGDVLYVRSASGEARLEAGPGVNVAFDSLTFGKPAERARGSLEDALRRGLFASEFGPSYYNGFVDQTPDLVPVQFEARHPSAGLAVEGGATTVIATRTELFAPEPRPPMVRLLIGLGGSTAVAQEFDVVAGLRVGVRPVAAGGGLLASLDLFRASRSGLAESRLLASGGWLRMARRRSFAGWAGAVAGGGAIAQEVDGQSTRWSGLLMASPVVGASLDLRHGLGLWLEGELAALAIRRDGASVVALAPAAWVGLSIGL